MSQSRDSVINVCVMSYPVGSDNDKIGGAKTLEAKTDESLQLSKLSLILFDEVSLPIAGLESTDRWPRVYHLVFYSVRGIKPLPLLRRQGLLSDVVNF